MSKSEAFENLILGLIFNATAIPDIAENDTTSPATSLTVSLHTSSPGEAGDMSTNEATYPGYTRITVPRTAGGWTLSGSFIRPTSEIVFPVAISGSETLTHIGIGSGVGDDLMYFGLLSEPIVVIQGVVPLFTTDSTITEV